MCVHFDIFEVKNNDPHVSGFVLCEFLHGGTHYFTVSGNGHRLLVQKLEYIKRPTRIKTNIVILILIGPYSL